MQRAIVLALIIGALGASFVLGRAQAQEADGGMDAVMKAWMELGKPGPEHAEFKKMAGNWSAATKSWHGPAAEPEVSEGKSKFSVVLGGLILRQDYDGKMGDIPFKGVGFTAFNKATGKYEAIWMDSMSSGIMCMNGTEIEKGKVIEYKGHFFGPGGVKVNSRMELKFVDDDTQTFTMWMDMGQGMKKANEITYTRVKE